VHFSPSFWPKYLISKILFGSKKPPIRYSLSGIFPQLIAMPISFGSKIFDNALLIQIDNGRFFVNLNKAQALT
jgi:hypothetical protein